MRIAMFTNNYLPHVGGVARSVKTLEDACRAGGHQVRIIAPEFGDEKAGTNGEVLRVAAIRNFNGSDFSIRLPVASCVHERLQEFAPDVIHSHQPLLMGDTALREAWKLKVPLVFTHHTLYERYVHYVPLDSSLLDPAFRRGAIQLATEYCQRCTRVIAPSASVRHLLVERGVTSPIDVVPTGVDTAMLAAGDGSRFRGRFGIPEGARVIGHVGRLVREKNLPYLTEAVAGWLLRDAAAVFLVVGHGGELAGIHERMGAVGLGGRLFAVGRLSGRELVDAYAAMDVFAFSSQSETQGMVLAEAMAAGVAVVALDGPGVRDIVRDSCNGLLLPADETVAGFASALGRLFEDTMLHGRCKAGALATAPEYAQERCAAKVIAIYQELVDRSDHHAVADNAWDRVVTAVELEWDQLAAKMAVAVAVVTPTAKEGSLE